MGVPGLVCLILRVSHPSSCCIHKDYTWPTSLAVLSYMLKHLPGLTSWNQGEFCVVSLWKQRLGESGFMKPFANVLLAVSLRSYPWPFCEPCSIQLQGPCLLSYSFSCLFTSTLVFLSLFSPPLSLFLLQVEFISSPPTPHDYAAPLLRTLEVGGSWRSAFSTGSPNGSDTNTSGDLCF